jgi:hypothetical protein
VDEEMSSVEGADGPSSTFFFFFPSFRAASPAWGMRHSFLHFFSVVVSSLEVNSLNAALVLCAFRELRTSTRTTGALRQIAGQYAGVRSPYKTAS